MGGWHIYALKDPRTREIRYVGWTTKGIDYRLRTHISEGLRAKRTYKNKWVFSLLRIGLHPTAEVLESGDGDGWADAERRWISICRANGARLVNGTDGGDGVVGLTPEQRQARARTRISRTTPEQRSEVLKRANASRTPEQRKASLKKARESRTAESMKASMKWALSHYTFEQRSAASKKGNRFGRLYGPKAKRNA